LRGSGFVANGNVDLLENGLPLAEGAAGPTGAFTFPFPAPFIARGESSRVYTATSSDTPAVTAKTTVRYTALDLSVRPTGGKPQTRRRIRARGFTSDRTLYAHI